MKETDARSVRLQMIAQGGGAVNSKADRDVNGLTWPDFLLVATGGALGSSARWAVNVLIAGRFGTELNWPWATFSVNILGSFLIGLVAGLATSGVLGVGPSTRLFLAVGILGGFTTFSSFAFELLTAAENGRFFVAAAYAGLSVLLGLAAAAAGLGLGRLVR
ncbi:MAG: hypothetical protein NVS2B17_18420 [Candidatus Velthaea sp.]